MTYVIAAIEATILKVVLQAILLGAEAKSTQNPLFCVVTHSSGCYTLFLNGRFKFWQTEEDCYS